MSPAKLRWAQPSFSKLELGFSMHTYQVWSVKSSLIQTLLKTEKLCSWHAYMSSIKTVLHFFFGMTKQYYLGSRFGFQTSRGIKCCSLASTKTRPSLHVPHRGHLYPLPDEPANFDLSCLVRMWSEALLISTASNEELGGGSLPGCFMKRQLN